jgi:uncharacterized Zn finger protein
MTRWERWRWYEPAPKKPPPKRGIKMKESGSTWWGRRWVEALEHMAGYSNRLARGRTYARAGRTHDLVVKAGQVTARVTGSRATPYKVSIALVKLTDAVWDKAIAAMAGKAQFSVELLAGQMPREIDAAFKEAGASVFPVTQADLTTDCSCPDWANPCKHVAATHYVLGEALDRDPFLLFELRGRTREQVFEALRSARAGADGEQASRSSVSIDQVPSVSLGELEVADYDTPREPLPALHLRFEAPPTSGGVLRQLGMPVGWNSDASPLEMLGPLIRAAADRARTLAMAEPEVEVDADGFRGTVATSPLPKRTRTPAAAMTRGRTTKRSASSRTEVSRPATRKATSRKRAAGTSTKESASNKAPARRATRAGQAKAGSTRSATKIRTAKAKTGKAVRASKGRQGKA